MFPHWQGPSQLDVANFAVNVLVSIGTIGAVIVALAIAFQGARAQRVRERLRWLEGRAQRQAAEVIVEMVEFGVPSPGVVRVFSRVRNGSNRPIRRLHMSWAEPGKAPSTAIFEKPTLDAGDKWPLEFDSRWEKDGPEVVLRFEDAFGDHWELRPDGSLTLFSPRKIRETAATRLPYLPEGVEPDEEGVRNVD